MNLFFTLTCAVLAQACDYFSLVSVRKVMPVAAVPSHSHPVLTKPANRSTGVFRMGRGRSILTAARPVVGGVRLAWLVLLPAAVCAVETAGAVKLAIVPEMAEAAPLVDVLTVELSQNNQLQLLERTAVEKIYREQVLAAGGLNRLKLGQVLGADGLLLLEKNRDVAGEFLQVQLVAVKPGVLLASLRFAWPLTNAVGWSGALVRHLTPQLPKLGVLGKDAVPISVVNLRSAIQSSAARELERQLTLLAIERLSREPELFVLERRRMQSLAAEKELAGVDDTAFWDGSCLLDGTLDNSGYAPETVTVSARLTQPKGIAPVAFEVHGSRTNLSEVVNRLAEKILETLKPGAAMVPWNAADEADQYYAEAQWALKWGLYPQAQAAAESAWALGRKTPDQAHLLIQTYADSVPDQSEGGDGLNIRVLEIPDANGFAPLDRGLELFNQYPALLFGGTNATRAFRLGMHLLRPAFGLLESYYYAAEMRASHADELLALREKVRRTFILLDAQPPLATNSFQAWNNPQASYTKLKWSEGGICFEHPEEALPFYQKLLESGDRFATLPRIIGWTWADRQRVPPLLRQLVDLASASPQPGVRLEGLFFALLLAPNDEQGSLLRSEEALVAAMWEFRDELYRSKETMALVECTRVALSEKLGGDSIHLAFSHEPFASFKHRLRLDFLAQATTTNIDLIQELFHDIHIKAETPEQARELVPAMEKALTRLSWKYSYTYMLRDLRAYAGLPDEQTPPPLKPKIPAAELLEAKFIPWQLSLKGVSSGSRPQFRGMILRNGRLWVRVGHLQLSRVEEDEAPISYLVVDPQRGMQEEIIFPNQLGRPSGLFEVSSNALFVEAGGHLFEYRFRERAWTDMAVPMEGAGKLLWLQNRLYISRSDGLLALQPETKQVQLLVSTRRTPSVNEPDQLWTSQTLIYARADGRLGGLSADHAFTFDPGTERWDTRSLRLAWPQDRASRRVNYISANGVQRILPITMGPCYLVGFWNDDRPFETLLQQDLPGPSMYAHTKNKLPQARWDWPPNYPLEDSQILSEDNKLWLLTPRTIWPGKEPIDFADQRTATLFCYTPDFRQPLVAAINFPADALDELPRMNGRTLKLLEPETFGYVRMTQGMEDRDGNTAFWLRTAAGLVLGGRNYGGHWLISDAALAAIFESQRKLLQSSVKP